MFLKCVFENIFKNNVCNWGYITNFYKRINIRDVYDIANFGYFIFLINLIIFIIHNNIFNM